MESLVFSGLGKPRQVRTGSPGIQSQLNSELVKPRQVNGQSHVQASICSLIGELSLRSKRKLLFVFILGCLCSVKLGDHTTYLSEQRRKIFLESLTKNRASCERGSDVHSPHDAEQAMNIRCVRTHATIESLLDDTYQMMQNRHGTITSFPNII